MIFKCTVSYFTDQGDGNVDLLLVCVSFGCVAGVNCNLTDVICNEVGIQAFAVIRKVNSIERLQDAELL